MLEGLQKLLNVPLKNILHIVTNVLSLAQTKKGIKRKADTTTPNSLDATIADVVSQALSANTPSMPSGQQLPVVPGAISSRRESARTIKKPKKDLPEEEAAHFRRGPMTEQMKYCHNIMKELLSKKHQVCTTADAAA